MSQPAHFEACKLKAERGDAKAALLVAEEMTNSVRGRRDPQAAVRYWLMAADGGEAKAVRKIFDYYYFCVGPAPENKAKAEEYLARAVKAGDKWAELVAAARLRGTNPQEATAIYLKYARQNDCFAQGRAAEAYQRGRGIERNATQAYFWALLASVGGFARDADIHPLAHPVDPDMTPLAYINSLSENEACGPSFPKERYAKGLPREFIAMAQNAATAWQPGAPEPALLAAPVPPPAPAAPPRDARKRPPGQATPTPTPETRPIAREAPLPPWRPVDNQNRPAQLTKTVSAAQVFEAASDAVWVVVAQGAGGWVAQGSAVAVTSRELVTNCHVIVGGASVTLRQRRQQRTATLVAANRASDRCILAVSGDALPVVAPTRPYRSLRVGEDVLTIGSPVGLESTLGNGIISGLRRLRGQSLVQTTAPISAGSSGGGLFDTYGNLIGITTFMLKTRSSSISRLPSTSTFDDRPSPLIGSLS